MPARRSFFAAAAAAAQPWRAGFKPVRGRFAAVHLR